MSHSTREMILWSCYPLLITLVSKIWVVLNNCIYTSWWNRFGLISFAIWPRIFEVKESGCQLASSQCLVTRNFPFRDCIRLIQVICSFWAMQVRFFTILRFDDHFLWLFLAGCLVLPFYDYLSLCYRWGRCFLWGCRRNLFSRHWWSYPILPKWSNLHFY